MLPRSSRKGVTAEIMLLRSSEEGLTEVMPASLFSAVVQVQMRKVIEAEEKQEGIKKAKLDFQQGIL